VAKARGLIAMPMEDWIQHCVVARFLYDWQTLVAGALAVLAAVGTIWATIKSADREIAASQAQTALAQKQIEVGQRQFELEGPFLQPIIQSLDSIAQGLKFFSMFDHSTGPVPPVASETSFKIRNVGRSPALLKSVAAQMDHWTEMVAEPRVDFLARFDVEPVIKPGEETEQTFTQTVTVPIDKLAFESLKSGKSHLFLYGEIAFSDLLGEDYVQTFCFAYNFQAQRFVRWGGGYNKRARAPVLRAARGRRS
jgi:hypothetical protein